MQKIIYTLIIYLVFFALTYSYFNIKEKKISKQNTGAYVLLALALVFRLLISTSVEGHLTDIACFKQWAQRLAQLGPGGFYAKDYFADYPPGYMLVLYVIGFVSKLFGFEYSSKAFTLLIKLPSMAADVILGYVVYKYSLQNQSRKSANVLMLLAVFSPAVIINSTIWGQIDSFFTLFMILSLICVYKEQYYMGAFLYTLCALIKPQAFLVAPVYLCAYFETRDWKLIAKSAMIALATVLITALPFTQGFNFMWLYEKYKATLSSYPYATINAYNLYALMGLNWRELSAKFFILPVSVWSYITILAVTALSVWFYFKSRSKAKLFYAAYLIVAVMFTIGAKMHERYMYPALFLLAMTFVFTRDKRLIFLFIAQTAAHYLNVGDVLVSNLSKGEINSAAVAVSAILHIASLCYSLYLAYDIFIPHEKAVKPPVSIQSQPVEITRLARADYIIMAVITLVYSVVAFAGLGDKKAPQTFYYNTKTHAIIDLGEEREIGSVLMYLGIGSGNYTLEASKDKSNWEKYGELKHDSVFLWKRATGEGSARFLKITASRPELMLGEVGVMGADGRLLEIASSTVSEIADEQSVVPQKPSYMNGTYFDEVYHPRTAYEILHKLDPYEITHPPLGKVIMSLGIMFFGMTPFGWRFMGTVAGIIMVPVFYLMCKKLVKRTDFAAIGTVIFTFDFMHYTQTRMATIDSFAVLLIMLMYLFIIDYYVLDINKEPLKKGFVPLALCGITFGIGAAVKWICLYSALGLAVIILMVWIRALINSNGYSDIKQKLVKSVAWCVLFFIVVPLAIYFASYLPQLRYDLHGRTPIGYVADNQSYMLNYHKGVTEDHPYKSSWYEWVIDKRPLWAYIDGELKEQNIISSISTFGNPAVWWAGLAAIAGCIYLAVFRKNKNALIIFIGYMSQLVPWIFVPRILFIYHYFACVPFIVLAIACCAKHLNAFAGLKMREIYGYCAVVVLLFMMFYPVISGVGVSKDYVVNVLKWFESWTFLN